jgi:hypothetical protein
MDKVREQGERLRQLQAQVERHLMHCRKKS